MSTTPADHAKSAAWMEALSLAKRDRTMASELFIQAECNVMRRLLCSTLPGGEEAYWKLVRKELVP